MIADSIAWDGISQSLITAAAALLGVLIGGRKSAKNQERERRNARIRQQLEGFYSPLLGMHAEIEAKDRLRNELHSIGDRVWRNLLDGYDGQTKARIQQERWPDFEKIVDYSEDQFREELIPLYEKMLEHFGANIWLAEPATIGHYRALSDFVEIRRRRLAKSIPAECFKEIDRSEEQLEPLYEDLKEVFAKLTRELRE
jgi:hypothetical protein